MSFQLWSLQKEPVCNVKQSQLKNTCPCFLEQCFIKDFKNIEYNSLEERTKKWECREDKSNFRLEFSISDLQLG